ncbi:hypothetical protein D8674_040769 [Pyrus ussuriensis x Pyrus communis]|uniref:Uncharacterized protein n=1 Tax=Pyrus ussuriensis x Pyrus communis TaxID=2448454 RepID=A0A5N5GLA7_9ROSA|nr:hypothetical protein D8674_040769 [Pyrus ussuriensis x Pyrus communis]
MPYVLKLLMAWQDMLCIVEAGCNSWDERSCSSTHLSTSLTSPSLHISSCGSNDLSAAIADFYNLVLKLVSFWSSWGLGIEGGPEAPWQLYSFLLGFGRVRPAASQPYPSARVHGGPKAPGQLHSPHLVFERTRPAKNGGVGFRLFASLGLYGYV